MAPDTLHYQPEDGFILRVRRSTYWARKMASLIGIWPHEDVELRVRWYRMLYYLMLSSHWFNTYVQLEYFFRNLGNLSLIIQGLCTFGSICTTGIKAMRMHAYEAEIWDIWKAMENASFFTKMQFLRKGDNKPIFERIDKNVDRQWKEVHLNLRFYCLVVGAVAFTYSIIPACSNLYNQFQGNEFNRSFVYNTYYPLIQKYVQRSPLFEVLFCSESLSGFTTWAGVVAFDGLYVVLVLYATSLMRMLGELLQETTNPEFSDDERAFLLRECLQQHIQTIELIKKINDLFAPVLLVQLLTSTSIICVIAFAASFSTDEGESQKALMVLYLIAAIYQLFQFCWYGQRLQNEVDPTRSMQAEWEQYAPIRVPTVVPFSIIYYLRPSLPNSIRLPLAVYDARWESCAQTFKSSYHILLMSSQRQIDIRAWSFSGMSLETFSTIIRSAASYFTVLQTLAEQ